MQANEFFVSGIIHVQSDTRIFCVLILLHGYKVACCKLSHNEDKNAWSTLVGTLH